MKVETCKSNENKYCVKQLFKICKTNKGKNRGCGLRLPIEDFSPNKLNCKKCRNEDRKKDYIRTINIGNKNNNLDNKTINKDEMANSCGIVIMILVVIMVYKLINSSLVFIYNLFVNTVKTFLIVFTHL